MRPATTSCESVSSYSDTGVGPDAQLVKRHLEQLLADYYKPISRQWATPAFRFATLRQEWEDDTAISSSITEISMHPAYQQIIGMGPIAIPFILLAMQERQNHWFWALKSITGEDPVPAKSRGKIIEMTQAWLFWGHEQKYL